MGIDAQLEKVVGSLVTAEAQVATGTFGSSRRPWVDFRDVAVAGKFDLAGIHKIFDRSKSNDQYAKALDGKAKAKEVQTSKLSSDLLAAFERDHRMRTRSRVRMMVHGGNRAWAHGTTAGPLRRSTVDFLSRLLSETAE